MNVAVVDYKDPEAASEFVSSIVNTGFAIVKNHPIAFELIDSAFREWKEFFQQPTVQKNRYLFSRNFDIVQGGFFPLNVSETAKGFSAKDIKEFFTIIPAAITFLIIFKKRPLEFVLSLLLLQKNCSCGFIKLFL